MNTSMNKGLNFEREVASIFRVLGAEVKHNVVIAGNQVDILISERLSSGQEIKTIIECKAYQSKVPVGVIRSFATISFLLKSRELIDKAMLVSLNGYTAAGRQLASELGIELLEIDDLKQKISGREKEYSQNYNKLINEDERVNKIESKDKRKKIFVVMPFSKEFDDIYVLGIREVAEKLGLVAERADNVEFSGDILSMVFEKIKECDYVIGDTTYSNPNVMYELGYSEGISKPAILICRKDNDIPFDIKGLNHIMYESILHLREKLERRLKKLL